MWRGDETTMSISGKVLVSEARERDCLGRGASSDDGAGPVLDVCDSSLSDVFDWCPADEVAKVVRWTDRGVL